MESQATVLLLSLMELKHLLTGITNRLITLIYINQLVSTCTCTQAETLTSQGIQVLRTCLGWIFLI